MPVVTERMIITAVSLKCVHVAPYPNKNCWYFLGCGLHPTILITKQLARKRWTGVKGCHPDWSIGILTDDNHALWTGEYDLKVMSSRPPIHQPTNSLAGFCSGPSRAFSVFSPICLPCFSGPPAPAVKLGAMVLKWRLWGSDSTGHSRPDFCCD